MLKKNSFMFLFYLVLFFGFLLPLINSETLTGAETLEFGFVSFFATYVFWLVIGSIWSHEQTENKYSGYKFLRILPISNIDIVGSKFLLVILSLAIYLIFNLLWLSSLFRGMEVLTAAHKYLFLMAALGLGICGVLYVGVFRFGFSKFGKYLMIIWLLLIIGQIPLRILLRRQFGVSDDDIARWADGINLLPVILICVTVFALSFYYSLKFSKTNRD